MKKKNGYLKPCNNPYKEKAEKLEKRAIVASIIGTIFMAILVFVIVFWG